MLQQVVQSHKPEAYTTSSLLSLFFSSAVQDESNPFNFDFPKKIVFGNNDIILCRDRQIKLAEYLRCLLRYKEFPDSSVQEYLSCFLDVPSQLYSRAAEVQAFAAKSNLTSTPDSESATWIDSGSSIVRNLEKVFQHDSNILHSSKPIKRKLEVDENFYGGNEDENVVIKANIEVRVPLSSTPSISQPTLRPQPTTAKRPALGAFGQGNLKVRNLYVEKTDFGYLNLPVDPTPGDHNPIQCNQSIFVTSVQVRAGICSTCVQIFACMFLSGVPVYVSPI